MNWLCQKVSLVELQQVDSPLNRTIAKKLSFPLPIDIYPSRQSTHKLHSIARAQPGQNCLDWVASLRSAAIEELGRLVWL